MKIKVSLTVDVDAPIQLLHSMVDTMHAHTPLALNDVLDKLELNNSNVELFPSEVDYGVMDSNNQSEGTLKFVARKVL